MEVDMTSDCEEIGMEIEVYDYCPICRKIGDGFIEQIDLRPLWAKIYDFIARKWNGIMLFLIRLTTTTHVSSSYPEWLKRITLRERGYIPYRIARILFPTLPYVYRDRFGFKCHNCGAIMLNVHPFDVIYTEVIECDGDEEYI